MTFTELFNAYGFKRMCDVAKATGLTKAHLSNLWYGHDRLGANLARQISKDTGIPLIQLLEAQPEPPPGRRGRPRNPRP